MNHQKILLAPGLYLVATPIGTARDITLRALDTLASAEVLAAEDTRTLRRLMEIHGIPLAGRPMIAYHDHSGPGDRTRILNHLEAGKSVAYSSEAGTPLVADPGYTLTLAVREAGHLVTSAPGPSAVVTALSIGGLPTDKFAFMGFAPNTRSARQSFVEPLRELEATLVFYESPGRLYDLLADLAQVLGADRRASVCRELTKKFEEVRSGTLAELVEAYDGERVRGEIVVLVDRAHETQVTEEDIVQALQQALETMRIKDAATAVAGALNVPRREVYQMALSLKNG